jgi:triacylglycerol lipase
MQRGFRARVARVHRVGMVCRMKPPSKLLYAIEFPRGAYGLATLMGARRMLARGPEGDGRPVMLVPGLFTTDRADFFLRRYLRRLGYRAYGWGLGRNLGTRTIGPDGEKLFDRIRALHAETGERVTLIGVSLGGIMARYAAHRMPEHVREVITISSPYAGSPRATNVWRAFELLTGDKIDAPRIVEQSEIVKQPLPVPTTAIWSRTDGLVNGLICHDDECRSIEVRSSHVGVQVRPEVLLAVAKILGGEATPPTMKSEPFGTLRRRKRRG